jgi:hypothetical protein
MVPVVGVRGKPQMQPTSGRSWTKEKERQFLEVLSETCNVTRACEAVGMSTNGAYKRRRKNAAFRAAWVETISAAYQRLELVLLDRTFNGTEKVIERHDGTEDRMREYPNGLGLSLLKMHRSTIERTDEVRGEEDIEELRERLIKKLLRLKKRTRQ